MKYECELFSETKIYGEKTECIHPYKKGRVIFESKQESKQKDGWFHYQVTLDDFSLAIKVIKIIHPLSLEIF